MASCGCLARAKSLTAKERRRIAKQGGMASARARAEESTRTQETREKGTKTMKMWIGVLFVFIGSMCWAQSSVAVAQQFPRAEVFVGVSDINMDSNGLLDLKNAVGWNSSFVTNFRKWVGVEAEVGGYYKNYGLADNFTAKAGDYTFMGGPRFTYKPFFVHMLVGADRLSGTLTEPTCLTCSFGSIAPYRTAFARAVGGGVELPISRSIAFRTSADYVLTVQNSIRTSVGIVYRFGFVPND